MRKLLFTSVRSIVATAAAAVAVVVIALVFFGSGGARSCSSYPAPGTAAPAGALVPASLLRRYAVLSAPQRAVDQFPLGRLNSSLSAADVVMSGTRLLGRTAFGARVYLLPASHLLEHRLAPARCFTPAERPLERTLRPLLQRQYREPALCIELVDGASDVPSCTSAGGSPEALLAAQGSPAFGLVPNGISAVTVTYGLSPPVTVAVHHNFFLVNSSSPKAVACGLQWLDSTGNVARVVFGCSYLAAEKQAMLEYRYYVAAKLSLLRSQLALLASTIRAGSVRGAESAWLTAHRTWLEIGQDDGAYGCFGQLGGDIDGLAEGHPLGTADPHFTGFHRVEYELWTAHNAAAALSQTTTLQRLLARLMRAPLASYLPTDANGIAAWLLRPHEVLEDALRDSLTADDDYGSGSDLASLTADVSAVSEMLQLLRPILSPIALSPPTTAERQLNALISAIDATRRDGNQFALQDLPVRQRELVDADLGAVLETLAPLPDLLTSTGRNAPTS
jgi:high-affinity iron transporter